MRRFENFACIDWSGAKTERPPGIAVALAGPSGPPALLSPNPRWSRENILKWLRSLAEIQANILIGMDLSFGLPYLDTGRYFPHWEASPNTAKSLWELIDTICAPDNFLGANSFVNHPEASRHFLHGKDRRGDLFTGGTGRLRVVERHQRDTLQANSASCFNLVGAAQVGKSSLTGMRMLHQLNGAIPVWPFDPLPDTGPVLVEIYTTMAARAAGVPMGRSKIRDRVALDAAFAYLNSPAPTKLKQYDDHSTDALITAAWLRKVAGDAGLWNAVHMTNEIAEKEGWTFGVI